MTALQKHLQQINACKEARRWATDRTPEQAWEECQRADWLLWWAANTDINSPGEFVLCEQALAGATGAANAAEHTAMCALIHARLRCPFSDDDGPSQDPQEARVLQ